VHNSLTALLSFTAITAAAGAVLLGLRELTVRGRAPAVEPSLLRHLPRSHADSPSPIARFDHWLQRTLYLSGTEMTVATATLLMLLAGTTLAAGLFVAFEDPLFTLLGGVLGTAGALAGIAWSHRRRVQRARAQFPAALDLLARAVRAGESFDQSIQLLGQSTAEPLATEFRRCARQMELGLPVAATMQALNDRLRLVDVRIFSATVAVHREAGGNLVETLERLARVIRDRSDYHRQLRSITGAGRMSVMLIAALGPILFAYLFLFQPEYGRKLWEDPLGRTFLMFAVVSQALGLLWVWQLLRADY